MNFKEIKRRLLTKEEYGGSSGCLMPIGLFIAFIGALFLIPILIKLFFCTILSLECIDEETGSKVKVAWQLFIPLPLGIFLMLIDIAYSRLKNNK